MIPIDTERSPMPESGSTLATLASAPLAAQPPTRSRADAASSKATGRAASTFDLGCLEGKLRFLDHCRDAAAAECEKFLGELEAHRQAFAEAGEAPRLEAATGRKLRRRATVLSLSIQPPAAPLPALGEPESPNRYLEGRLQPEESEWPHTLWQVLSLPAVPSPRPSCVKRPCPAGGPWVGV